MKRQEAKHITLKFKEPNKGWIRFSGKVRNVKLTDYDITIQEVIIQKFEEIKAEYDLIVDIRKGDK